MTEETVLTVLPPPPKYILLGGLTCIYSFRPQPILLRSYVGKEITATSPIFIATRLYYGK